MATLAAYQIPDILELTVQRNWQLRSNSHCRAVTSASQSWFLEKFASGSIPFPPGGSDRETAAQVSFTNTKCGLLSSLCFPTCDMSPLRLVTDIQTAIVLTDWRMRRLRLSYFLDINSDDASISPPPEPSSFEDIFNRHVILKHLLINGQYSFRKMSSSWRGRFTTDVQQWHQAHRSQLANMANGVILQPKDCISLRAQALGVLVLFHLTELVEGLDLDPLEHDDNGACVRNHCQCRWRMALHSMSAEAANILAIALDILAYNADQSSRNNQNLITSLMHHNQCGLQRAIEMAEILLHSSFESFTLCEAALLPQKQSTTNTHPPTSTSSFWSMNNLSRFFPVGSQFSTPTPNNSIPLHHLDPNRQRDIERYAQSLRDFLVGILNWAFESNLYFNTEGDDVRAFGWVFLTPPVA